MTYRRFRVKFAVKGHPDPKTETVIVEGGIVDGADPEERAVAAAAEKSTYSHAETLAIGEVKENA